MRIHAWNSCRKSAARGKFTIHYWWYFNDSEHTLSYLFWSNWVLVVLISKKLASHLGPHVIFYVCSVKVFSPDFLDYDPGAVSPAVTMVRMSHPALSKMVHLNTDEIRLLGPSTTLDMICMDINHHHPPMLHVCIESYCIQFSGYFYYSFLLVTQLHGLFLNKRPINM